MIKFKQSPIDINTKEVVKLERKVKFHYQLEQFEVTNTGLNISLSPVSNSNYIEKNGKKYILSEMHFHRPSEHHIDSKQFDMEVHLVHDGDHETIVYSVLLQICKHGFAFGHAFDNIDKQVSIDLCNLVAETCWDYHGSLTTSPFNEVVIWLINQQMMTIDASQAALINHYYPNNNRCLQPVNDRKVYTVSNCIH